MLWLAGEAGGLLLLLKASTTAAAFASLDPLLSCRNRSSSRAPPIIKGFESKRDDGRNDLPSPSAAPAPSALKDLLTSEACADIAAEVSKCVALPFYVPQPIITAAATLVIETISSELVSADLTRQIADVAISAGTTETEFDDASDDELDALAEEMAAEINFRIDLPVLDEEQEFVVFRQMSRAVLAVLATSDAIDVEPRALIERSVTTARDLLGGREGRAELARVLNAKVDFPFLNEADEEILLLRALDACAERLEEVLPPELIHVLRGEGVEGMEKTKQFIVDSLNRRVDVVGLSEEQEGWLIENVVDVVIDALIGDTETELLLMSPKERREALIERRAIVQREIDVSRRRFEVEQRHLAAQLERIDRRLSDT